MTIKIQFCLYPMSRLYGGVYWMLYKFIEVEKLKATKESQNLIISTVYIFNWLNKII